MLFFTLTYRGRIRWNGGIIAAMICLFSFAGNGQELLVTETSWNGAPFSYPSGNAKMTAVKLLLKQGEPTGFHCHPVPTFAYILSGNLDVETSDGDKISLIPGQSMVEVMRTLHQGTPIGGDVEILVFYAGSDTLPNTVLADTDESVEHCIEHKNLP